MERVTMSEREYINWLYHVPGIGRKKMEIILSQGIVAEEIYHMSREVLRAFFGMQCHFSEKQADTIVESIWTLRKEKTPAELMENLYNKEVLLLLPGDPEYPEKLEQTPDPPFVLYMKGNKQKAHEVAKKSVAIIGARDCSEYGRYVAQLFGAQCARADLPVVSGMAYGVDGIAQWAALSKGAPVAAVLGCGVDICYPASNRKLYDALIEQGCIFSEYTPGTEPKPTNFPPRNRIISGIADALVVVEAREKSGTQITVDMALEQGKDVYVVPGRITDRMSDGCNRMIRQGGMVVCDVKEVVEEIKYGGGYMPGCAAGNGAEKEEGNRNPYPEEDFRHAIYLALDIEPKSVQQIYESDVWGSGKWEKPSVDVLQTELFYFKMKNYALEKNGRYFVGR